jgi:hypothetical protein
VSLSAPSHAPHLHLPALRLPALPSGLPVATVLLSVLYAAALAVALTAPGQHAVAGCVVLAGLVGRTVVRRRRAVPAAVAATTAAVDSIAVLPADAPATAPAVAA